MRTGPLSGSSTFVFVSVSESRIDPAQRLVTRQRCDHRPELGAALLPGQRHAQCPEVAADRLQLAHERARVEISVAALEHLAEPFQRLGRVDLSGSGGVRIARAYARASLRSRAPRSAGTTSSGASAAAASASSLIDS